MTHDRKQSIYRAKNGEVAVLLRMYNFSVEYKPGRLNVVADALSRRPDFESAAQYNSGVDTTVATLVTSVPSSTLLDDIKKAYAEDEAILRLMDHLVTPSRKSIKDLLALYRSSADRYTTRNGCCIIQPLLATHLVSSSPLIMICACASCMSAMMHRLVGIVGVRRLISR